MFLLSSLNCVRFYILLLIFARAEQQCSETSGAACPATEPIRLRWRPFPYHVSRPEFARRVYGGDFVAKAFGKHFEGPEENEDWDLLWTHRSQDSALASFQLAPRVGQRLANHCSYFAAAGNKCEFAQLASRLRKKKGRHLRNFDLSDSTHVAAWRKVVRKSPGKLWVMKPCFGGASRGIQIVEGQTALGDEERFGAQTAAQEYLEPFMGFGRRKFHLRLYVLVTRWSPVGAYLYDEGVVFRSKHDYDKGRVTNEHDIFSSISGDVDGVPLATLWQHLDTLAGTRVASSTAEVPRGAAQSVWSQMVAMLAELLETENGKDHTKEEASRGYSCFDLLGVDVILDKQLQPFVMEFNVGPNLWVDNHGKEYQRLLQPIKEPLAEQVANWAALRSRSPSLGLKDAESLENRTLLNFTRVL